MGLLPDTSNCGLRMRQECRERFPRHRLQRKPLVSDPYMYHGTCVRHVPWWMSGSLISGGGENVPGIPGAYATLNFTYLVRGTCLDHVSHVEKSEPSSSTRKYFNYLRQVNIEKRWKWKHVSIFPQNNSVHRVLTHSGLAVTPHGDIDPGQHLLTCGTKPLPEPMLTCHQWGREAVTWGRFHRYLSLKLVWILLT